MARPSLAELRPVSGKTVFISYNHQDKEVVHLIKNKLVEAGFYVMIDAEIMVAGKDIKSFIEKCVRKSDFILSLVSRNSLLSAWVAMGSMLSFFDEKLKKTRFTPCTIDSSFFERYFVYNALDHIG
ncbi:toll/interleukin-1 receptor domain-containing protein [Flammeovirgaceae bacterium SG7u.111]|nr:toll/interleukin-1 receptor domain-containing protein [Flammeovirgaceae bacterium SG7u.132]WPO38755.1 toll/interleukin-1 receptor domain-containing protein [Flammeovirgaceae bacterium SG7u.111]